MSFASEKPAGPHEEQPGLPGFADDRRHNLRYARQLQAKQTHSAEYRPLESTTRRRPWIAENQLETTLLIPGN